MGSCKCYYYTRMNLRIQKALIVIAPVLALLLGVFTFYKFQTYAPTPNLKSEGAVAGEKTQKFDLQCPNSQIISKSILQDCVSITQQTTNSPDKVLEYYKQMLTQNGWKAEGPAIYKKGKETITITLTKDANNITVVNVDHYSAVPTK